MSFRWLFITTISNHHFAFFISFNLFICFFDRFIHSPERLARYTETMERPETRTSSKSSAESIGIEYAEPLAPLRPKIVELCQSVGLGLPIALEEMECGTYNRVISK